MKVLSVDTGTKQYPIYIANDFELLFKAFSDANLLNKKICILTDTNVSPIYSKTIIDLLGGDNIYIYSFEAGENSKNLETIMDFYQFLSSNNFDRSSVLVALGGGVVGDMCGFAASTYMRGIPFVQIPTTLLAQVDSSVGGKTGVDFLNNKNMIGTFYQPEFVFINSSTLKTLPYKEVAAGIAEAIKYGYIQSSDFLEYFFDNKERIKRLDSEYIDYIIFKSCESKAYVVSQDERESDMREILNFGHTFGHSIESLSKFNMLHGECVAVGMISALYYSMLKGSIKMEDINKAKELLSYFELPISISNYKLDSIYNKMFSDKKTKNGVLNIVALNSIGDAYTDKGASEEMVKEAIQYLL